MSASVLRRGAAAVLAVWLASGPAAAVDPPTTVYGSFELASPVNGSGPLSGSMNDALGTAGASPGWSLFKYGEVGGQVYLPISSTASNPAQFQFQTTAGTTANSPPGPPANFNNAASYTWRIFERVDPANGYIRFPKADGTYEVPGEVIPGNRPDERYTFDPNNGDLPTTTLSTISSLATANARLNDVLKFDASEFYDAPGHKIDVTSADKVGDFTFSFADYAGGGYGYTSIDLNYTPVPEPILATGLAFGLAAVVARRRR